MKYLSVQELRALDQQAVANGTSISTLMERAGQGVAEHITLNYPLPQYPQITMICGKGNNGGDGLVVARLLAQAGYTIKIILLNQLKTLSPDAREQYNKLPKEIIIANYSDAPDETRKSVRQMLTSADLLVDAIFGTGFTGEVLGHYADIICACNASGKPIIAVDIPSGINGDNGPTSGIYIRATETLTFIAPKLAMQLPDHTQLFGEVEIIDLGISKTKH